VTEAPASPFLDTLHVQRAAWDERPLLRSLYGDWFAEIVARLSDVPGPTIELGSGAGGFAEYFPRVVATDIAASPWTDEVVDAERLPYGDGTVANLVMVDVLHHLSRPAAFLAEAERVLAAGGRTVLLEPYCSPASTIAYRRFHHEDLDLTVDPLDDQAHSGDDPFDANGALPTLLFWRHADAVAAHFPGLTITERRRLGWLAYPLSGGFTRKPFVGFRTGRALMRMERVLGRLLDPLLAFRCLVVLERTRHSTEGA
jgi:SAM-dependent methyltransferase